MANDTVAQRRLAMHISRTEIDKTFPKPIFQMNRVLAIIVRPEC